MVWNVDWVFHWCYPGLVEILGGRDLSNPEKLRGTCILLGVRVVGDKQDGWLSHGQMGLS